MSTFLYFIIILFILYSIYICVSTLHIADTMGKQKAQTKIQCPHHQEHHHLHGKYSPSRVENLFFLNGITALLGWNVILVSFDYFSNIYTDYNPILYFPVPLFVGYVLVSVSFNYLSRKLSYKIMVFSGIITNNLMLICLLFLTVVSSDNQAIGFYLSLFCCFIIGISNNFAQLSFFAMINYFGQSTVSKFTIGTAGSGLFLTVLQIIVASIFGADTTDIKGISVYIGLAIVYNFWDMFLNAKLFKSHFYHRKIIDTLPENEEKQKKKQLLSDASSILENPQKSYFRWLYETFFEVSPYPLFIMLNFVITFLLYPNIAFEVVTSLTSGWKILLINLMYNIGDFMGKAIGDFRWTFNSYSIKYLLVSRLIFFYTIIMLAKQFTNDDPLLHNDIFPFVNIFLFAVTNGFIINGSFILSFEGATGQYKKYAGVLGGILLQVGIMIGSFLAIPFEKLVDPDVNLN